MNEVEHPLHGILFPFIDDTFWDFPRFIVNFITIGLIEKWLEKKYLNFKG